MPTYLDLFAGAGGLSEGFIQAGYTPIAHVEMDKAACYTLKTRTAFHWLRANGMESTYNRYLYGEISRDALYNTVPNGILASVLNYEISEDNLPDIFERIDSLLNGEPLDLIIGGPPCQAYSLAGRARSESKMIGDSRNYLYKLYADFLKKYKPKFFVFENVTGLLSAKDEDGSFHFNNMQNLFADCGYSTEYQVLNAKDYGVLQNRKRIILIGKLGIEEKGYYPVIPHSLYPDIKVSEVLEDLPPLHSGEGSFTPVRTLHYSGNYLYEMQIKERDFQEVTFHIARPHTRQDLEIYKLVVSAWNENQERIAYPDLPDSLKSHQNTTAFLDRFKVVAKDLPYSQTVVAHVSRDGHYYIHPDLEQNRSLTPREVARLQTFPDNYYFESTKGTPGRTAAYRQIGNAVPVRLAYCVALALKEHFDEHGKGNDVHDKKTRSYNMSRIRGTNTKPEEMVRRYLFAKGFRFRKNDARLPGKPDIVLPKYKTVVFVNGCFWHKHEGCKYFVWPKNNADFWRRKINANVIRDGRQQKDLEKLGWKVIVIWECELSRDKFPSTMEKLKEKIYSKTVT